jgi:hypothetical protein
MRDQFINAYSMGCIWLLNPGVDNYLAWNITPRANIALDDPHTPQSILASFNDTVNCQDHMRQ